MKKKKQTFFRELLDPNSGVSSKRFSGLVLLGLFAISATLATFLDVAAGSVDLIKAEGYIGAALLGINIISQIKK